jgi:hypothetical protein
MSCKNGEEGSRAESGRRAHNLLKLLVLSRRNRTTKISMYKPTSPVQIKIRVSGRVYVRTVGSYLSRRNRTTEE